MKTFLLSLFALVALAGASLPERSHTDIENPDIDMDALISFAMITRQMRGVDIKNVTNLMPILPYLYGDHHQVYSYEQKMYLLTSSGIDREFSRSIILSLLPAMKEEGKSTKETVTTLLFFTKSVCQNAAKCEGNIDILLPLIRASSDRGCNGYPMTSSGNTSAPGEVCLCDEQANPLFWINLYEQLTKTDQRRNSTQVPDHLPLVMAMANGLMSCSGKLKYNQSSCSCSSLNIGEESIFIQYLVTSDHFRQRLSDDQRRTIRQAFAVPKQRIFGTLGSNNINVNDFITQLITPLVNPTLLAIINNQGQSNTDIIRQLILSSVGLDTSLLQVILNGGFGDDQDRVALINYLAGLGFLDNSIIPFLLGVDNGQQFFISSLIEAGQIDPTTALLLLGSMNGQSTEDIFGLLISAIGNQDNPDFFSSLGRPYIPPLPEGVFPGSRLFFAHFETLGVNTCALHDLRNRFECGFIGISAAQCETVPYCCYSPIFLTDEEVRNATDNAITAASAVPWCYYNIFFIYFENFYLPILRPGQFAPPVECAGLYRYGLQLDPTLVSLIDPSGSSSISNLIISRDECGFPGITEFQCVAVRGCCWDEDAPFRVAQCYLRNGATGIAFNYDNLPAAFRPANGSCNTNGNRIPVLYYQRVACHYTIDFHKIGYNLLAFPSRLDCLTKLGCCWEDNEEVLEQYPFTPQCYSRVGGVRVPSNVPGLSSLFLRSGEAGDVNFENYPGVPSPADE